MKGAGVGRGKGERERREEEGRWEGGRKDREHATEHIRLTYYYCSGFPLITY